MKKIIPIFGETVSGTGKARKEWQSFETHYFWIFSWLRFHCSWKIVSHEGINLFHVVDTPFIATIVRYFVTVVFTISSSGIRVE